MEIDCFVLQVKKSKTNQFGQRILPLPFSACANLDVCPVFVMLKHLTMSKLSPSMPLFSYLDKGSVYHMTHYTFVSKL
jgi:hypothetical protein